MDSEQWAVNSEQLAVSKDKVLIVGLGNPGKEHAGNRHNIGFMALDRLAAAYNIPLTRVKHQAVVGNGLIAGRATILAKPKTFMNRSGQAVGPIAKFYNIAPQNILVIYDELDIPFGTLRLRSKGGPGGHNGLKSIIQQLGPDFPRARLGIGRPPGRMPAAAYVLQNFNQQELLIVNELIDHTIQAIETFLREGIDLAMSRFNGTVLEVED